MIIRNYNYFSGLITFLFLFLNSSVVTGQWELSLDRDSVKVYNKPNSDGYSYYKASGYVHAGMDEVFNFITHIERFPEWVNNCVETEVLKRDGEELSYFALYEMPWPVSDRYSITRLTIHERSTSKVRLQSNPDTELDYVYKDGLRITRFNERVSLIQVEKDLTYIEMYGAYDPGGVIPSWLTDKFMKYGPFDAIKAIKERLE